MIVLWVGACCIAATISVAPHANDPWNQILEKNRPQGVDSEFVSVFSSPLYREFAPTDFRANALSLPDVTGSSSTKVVVLIHGWIPSASSEPFDPTKPLGRLCNELRACLPKNFPEWSLHAYSWRKDALITRDEAGTKAIGLRKVDQGTVAAEAAYIHGWVLGERLANRYPNLEQVQLIAHSAGSWAARSAAMFLHDINPNIDIQVTLLDPYIPGEACEPEIEISLSNGIQVNDFGQGVSKDVECNDDFLFGNNIISQLTKERMDELDISFAGVLVGRGLENYYSKDISVLGTQTIFDWDSRRSVQKEILNWQGVQTHDRPIDWYADDVASFDSKISGTKTEGWINSLPVKDRMQSLVLLIDVSGSMDDEGKIAQARQALLSFLDRWSSEAVIVPFNSDPHLLARTDIPRSEIRKKVSALSASGGTDIDSALQFSLDALSGRGTVLLLSDGQSSVQDSTITPFSSRNIPVYTMPFGRDADEALLQKIADQTGGEMIQAKGAQLLVQAFQRMIGQLNDTFVDLLAVRDVIHQGETKSLPFSIMRGTVEAVITLDWFGSWVDLKLKDPRGHIIAMNTQSPGIQFLPDRQNNMITVIIKNPRPGRWNAECVGSDIPPEGEIFSLSASAQVPDPHAPGIQVDIPFTQFSPGELATVGLESRVPLKEAVALIYTSKGAKPLSVPLNDDGRFGDVRGDGCYTCRIKIPDQIGCLPVKLIAKTGVSETRAWGTLQVGSEQEILVSEAQNVRSPVPRIGRSRMMLVTAMTAITLIAFVLVVLGCVLAVSRRQ